MYKNPTYHTISQLSSLKDKIASKAEQEFENQIEQFNINKAQNKEWSSQFYSLSNSTNKISKKIKRLKIWRWILIIFLIFPFFLLNNKIKKLEPELKDKSSKALKLKQDLDKQLNSFGCVLSQDLIYNKIIESVWNDVDLNLSLTNPETWEKDQEIFLPKNSYVSDLTSGKIFDHPFLLFNRIDQTMYNHVYTGSVTLPYTARDFNGHSHTEFEVITASITLPAPQWTKDTKLIYKSSFAPSLSFTNNVSKHNFKKWNKNQQALENKTFNKLAKIIRNDEQQIRVVFTPLAQEQFSNLLKEQKYWITKENNYTTIDLPKNEYSLNQAFNCSFNYDLDVWKQNFINQINDLVSTLFVFSLPIANLPVYYQMSDKPSNIKTNINVLQSQSNVSFLIKRFSMENEFETQPIFIPTECKKIKIDKLDFDCTKIECHYFHLHHRTETVMEPSLHHGVVPVPVEVIDYIPKSKTLYLCHSNNFNSSKEYVINNFACHSGELMSVSTMPFTSSTIKQALK